MTDNAAVQLRARLLGAFQVDLDGRLVDRGAFERPSGLRLLKLLLATPDHAVRREAAAEMMWPEADPERSAANLRKAIHFARRGLASVAGSAPVLVDDGDWLRFSPGIALDIDADRLRNAISELNQPTTAPRSSTRPDGPVSEPLQVVAELGGTELLPEDPYEEWLVTIRERLHDRVQACILQGIAAARARGDRELATRLAERALLLDPADESAHRAAIELHLEAGRLHAARRQLLACQRAVAETYGVEPDPELAALIDRASAERARATPERLAEPELIGRRRELERAEPILDAVAAGRPARLILRGTPGIGKSRLLRELVRSAEAGGWRVLELRGLELSADLAYGSLGQALSRAVPREIIEDWPEPERSALLTIVPERREDRDAGAPRKPLLAFATDVGLRAGLVAAARQLAAERPLVIAVDDLQWLDQASLALLGSLRSVDGPLLLLGTLRDEPRPADHAADLLVDAVLRAGGTELALGPLAPREIGLLLERDLGGTALGRDVADSIAELADGAPLYALELLRTAQETGTISLRDGEWRRTAPTDSLPVPHGVRRAVEARMARLAPTVRSILTVAAELGDEVSFELLVAASAEPPATVLDALDEGLALALLQEQAGRYRFGHPLFRAALRRDIPPRSRATLHGRIATALRRDVDPRDPAAIAAAMVSGTDAVAVASHAAAAVELGAVEALETAVGFGFAGGARQCDLFDYAGGVATLRRTLAMWYRLQGDVRGAFPASAAQHRLGLALKGLGDNIAAAEAFGGEIATAATDMDRARGYAALSWLPYEHGQFDRAEALLRTGIAAVSDSVPRAFLQSGLGWIRGRHGDWAAAHELLGEAVPVLEPEAPPAILARALDRFAVSIRDTGEPGRAVPVFERALSLALQAGDAHEEAMVRMHFAGALRELGDLDAARDHLVRALATCRLTGDRYIEAVSLWVLAEVEDSAGRIDEAIECRRRELEILHAIGGNPQNEALARAHIAHLAARAGDASLAAAEAQLARDRAAHAGLEHLPALVERALGAVDFSAVSHLHRDRPAVPAAAPPHSPPPEVGGLLEA